MCTHALSATAADVSTTNQLMTFASLSQLANLASDVSTNSTRIEQNKILSFLFSASRNLSLTYSIKNLRISTVSYY